MLLRTIIWLLSLAVLVVQEVTSCGILIDTEYDLRTKCFCNGENTHYDPQTGAAIPLGQTGIGDGFENGTPGGEVACQAHLQTVCDYFNNFDYQFETRLVCLQCCPFGVLQGFGPVNWQTRRLEEEVVKDIETIATPAAVVDGLPNPLTDEEWMDHIHTCRDTQYQLSLYYVQHFFLVATPIVVKEEDKERVVEDATCAKQALVFHANHINKDVPYEKQVLRYNHIDKTYMVQEYLKTNAPIIDDLGNGHRTFHMEELAHAYETSQANVNGLTKPDMAYNNCGDFLTSMASILKIEATTQMTKQIAQSVVQHAIPSSAHEEGDNNHNDSILLQQLRQGYYTYFGGIGANDKEKDTSSANDKEKDTSSATTTTTTTNKDEDKTTVFIKDEQLIYQLVEERLMTLYNR